MAADIEPKPLVADGSREPPYVLRIALQHQNRQSCLGELVCSGQSRGTGSDDDGFDWLPSHLLFSK